MRGQRGGGVAGVSANEYSCAHGAQINFGDVRNSMFNLWCNRTWLRAYTSWTWPSWRTCSTTIPHWTSRTSTGTILRTWRRQGKKKVRIFLFVYLQTCPLIYLHVFLHPFMCKVLTPNRYFQYCSLLTGNKNWVVRLFFDIYILCIMPIKVIFLNFAQIRREHAKRIRVLAGYAKISVG